MALITYDDKTALNENPSVPNVNKVTASDMNQIKNAINNLIYPVGSYYETSDLNFNPNTTWGGTWVLDSEGKVTVARDENDTDFDTIGATGGSKYLQEHTHKLKYYVNTNLSGGTDHFLVYGSNTATVLSSLGTESAGTGDSGNLQPYIVVNRWHRTA